MLGIFEMIVDSKRGYFLFRKASTLSSSSASSADDSARRVTNEDEAWGRVDSVCDEKREVGIAFDTPPNAKALVDFGAERIATVTAKAGTITI